MSNELIEKVAQAEKKTKVRVYLQVQENPELSMPVYDQIMIGNYDDLVPVLSRPEVKHFHVETLSRKSALGLEETLEMNARIEPGALIRKGAKIEQDAVILMGAVINTGARIDSKTMVDMNAVVGSGAQIGKRCHIGAGAVVAGMMEPAGNKPVILEDDVFVGANAVILEEVTVGHHSIIGAGAVVTKDVEPYSVMVGVPAIKIRENHRESLIESSLRQK